ncbi:MAG: hypothetical protein HYZ57_15295 [Acidobacteria bacterium]|nr:hypothetical protein [Acidobacteriota bacterium]
MHPPDYLEGAIDLHVHSAPDIDPRRYDDLELAREAAGAGMAGLLLKNHQFSTVERAWLVSQVVHDVCIFGGLVLNETVGGLNPKAVRTAIRLGAKEIWMPTRSAANHRRHQAQSGGIQVLDGDGALVPEAEEILQALAGSGCILGTGHLGPDEAAPLIRRARALGIQVLVTHPEWSGTLYPIELQRELAALGGVFFERCFVSTTHRCGFTPFRTIEDAIAAVGPESTVLASDLGQPDTPAPVEGLRVYAGRLRADGFPADQIRQMMQANPARLLSMVRAL